MSRPPTFDPPPGARTYRLATDRGHFAVVDSPSSAPRTRATALLLPGYTGSKEDFGPLHPALNAAGYRTVAVDGRGQYESEGPRDEESAYARTELMADVLAQTAALGERVHLVGHSLGGQIARAAVIEDSRPFLSLTLMSSGPAEISKPKQQRVELLGSVLGDHSMGEVWDLIQQLEQAAAATSGIEEGVLAAERNDPDPERLRRRWTNTSPAQLLATGRQLCTEPDLVAELAATGLPLHVLSGSNDDTWPVPLLDDMARRLGAHRTVVEGADHSPNVDRPEPTAKSMAAFWDNLPTD